MQYEFTKLEKLFHLIYKTDSCNITDSQIELWNTEILDEKERLQVIFKEQIEGRNTDMFRIEMYFHHHYERLKSMLIESEKHLISRQCKITDCLKDLIFYFEVNLYSDKHHGIQNVGDKCYIPLSVEVLAFLFKLLWDEGLVRMKFKSELARLVCKNLITLKGGEKSQLSEKHFLDAQYSYKESTINASEKIINTLKMRINHIRRERKAANKES
jgi:hypothetical protein